MSNATKSTNVAVANEALDREMADVLTAISVISRLLAKKISAKLSIKEDNNERAISTNVSSNR